MRASPRRPIALALAGGGPFGAVYEIGALVALEESIEGLELNALDAYVGVSAGGFLAAALANGIPVREIHALFIEGRSGEAPLTPELFMRPALREYLRRARAVPRLLARSLGRAARRPLSGGVLEWLAPLGEALPTGLFDNAAIDSYLEAAFSRHGRTNDFRRLRRRLYLVATELDTGASVTFGRPGWDHVPISRAVQASSALPGLFPPVEIDGRHFVDGALRKTLHASEALDDGAKLVFCLNPIVPFDASAATGGAAAHLADRGLPTVLSQTFRSVIHSRLVAGLAKYRTQYRGADVLLFEPGSDDREIFFTNVFGYAARRRICEHAYLATRRDLLGRAAVLAPVLARHGLGLRLDALRDRGRRLGLGTPSRGEVFRATLSDLDAALAGLRASLGPARTG